MYVLPTIFANDLRFVTFMLLIELNKPFAEQRVDKLVVYTSGISRY